MGNDDNNKDLLNKPTDGKINLFKSGTGQGTKPSSLDGVASTGPSKVNEPTTWDMAVAEMQWEYRGLHPNEPGRLFYTPSYEEVRERYPYLYPFAIPGWYIIRSPVDGSVISEGYDRRQDRRIMDVDQQIKGNPDNWKVILEAPMSRDKY